MTKTGALLEKVEELACIHCWDDGPPAEDGCGTTCMLLDGHDGPHEWTRDDQIRASFAP